MAIENKYRVHEVAKDFGVGNKEVTDILAKYSKAPKNHMQALGDHDLSLIFEVMTQDNQVSDMEAVLGKQARAARPAAEIEAAGRSAGQAPAAEPAERPAAEQGQAGAPRRYPHGRRRKPRQV